MGVIVRWLLLTGKHSRISGSMVDRWMLFEMWLLLTGKYSCVSGSIVDRWCYCKVVAVGG